ncbi:NADH/ubiquinone/plastoquinone (complex I) [Luteimonas aestuarii]|uniref:NADH/ubiquinone/plastoquinone (Complex I) n=1 Tax=Luteimonas aestuarii TaxID=453837 RepID=A0A4R5TT71_9GAMM|nr:proton-conducting transporter membrane subunit [Luteimonas aestuarii]TDK23014.1 NADH/ubiquinone/plastoquinone (complex I) [Luteimonas aestuarii]
MSALAVPAWIVAALLLPLLALAAVRVDRLRAAALVLAPLPLLVLALSPEGGLAAPRLLLGTAWAVDGVNRPLLLLAGLGFALAGGVAGARVSRAPTLFATVWLLVLAGVAQALLAAELAGFYTGYLVMSLTAYGLVVHAATSEALRAGRVYLVMALLGEAMVLAGVLQLAGSREAVDVLSLASQPPAPGVAWLLFAGFAVKLGLVPLHLWLPVAHPVAPVPASAVLSGVLVKLGLLGMMRVLPEGSLAPATLVFFLGLATSAYGALAGLAQSRLKTVLAYSTVSQMGLLFAGFAALQAAGGGTAVLGLLALHHGLNKIALFLAAGGAVGASRVRATLFALPALALVGLPAFTGALAKDALKSTLAPAGWEAFAWMLSIGSLLTALLMLHGWRLARADRGDAGVPPPIHPAWPLAVLAGIAVPWAWAVSAGLARSPLAGIWDALWPALLALVAWTLATRLRGNRAAPRIPEGDLLQPLATIATALRNAGVAVLDRWNAWQPPVPHLRPLTRLAALEPAMVRLPGAGGLMLVLLLVIAALAWRAS